MLVIFSNLNANSSFIGNSVTNHAKNAEASFVGDASFLNANSSVSSLDWAMNVLEDGFKNAPSFEDDVCTLFSHKSFHKIVFNNDSLGDDDHSTLTND